MAGSVFGTLLKVSTWGESHGPAVGVVADGFPAGIEICRQDIQSFLDRRKPGQNRFTTARAEKDQVEILSGVFDGKTTGTPVSLLVRNEDHHSADYEKIASFYRPGHADEVYDLKYGFRDYRGGGRSSGRETIGRVAAGAVASKALSVFGVSICAFTASIGPVKAGAERFDEEYIRKSPLYMPDEAAEKEAAAFLEQCAREGTSAGGTVSCIVKGMPAGLGEPVFDKLDALLGQAMFSIGAVKAVEIGDGVRVSVLQGHENNDCFEYGPDKKARKLTNHAGGVYGGISDGSDLRITVHFKPTPSIAREQNVLCADGTVQTLKIGGRHDPVIVPRAVVVVESMAALTILELMMRNASSSMDSLSLLYGRDTR